MSYPTNYPTPQGANVQIFYRTNNGSADWVKPQGASFVWFTVISAGGVGDGSTTGGGSSAVTNCLMPAFLIPDVLRIVVGNSGAGNANSRVIYQAKDGTGYILLTANPGSVGTGGAASTSNFFSAAGFFQSVAGQDGNAAGVSASPTTFLSGGSANPGTPNYGYPSNLNGYFQMQPIIVGLGGGNVLDSTKAGIGCGGAMGNTLGAEGGDGLVVIISW